MKMETLSIREMLSITEEYKKKLSNFILQMESLLTSMRTSKGDLSEFDEDQTTEDEITIIMKDVQAKIDKLLCVLSEKKYTCLKQVTMRQHSSMRDINPAKVDSGISIGSHDSTASLPIQETDGQRFSLLPLVDKSELPDVDTTSVPVQESYVPEIKTVGAAADDGTATESEIFTEVGVATLQPLCTRLLKSERHPTEHNDYTIVSNDSDTDNGAKEDKVGTITCCENNDTPAVRPKETCRTRTQELSLVCDKTEYDILYTNNEEKSRQWKEVGVQTDSTLTGEDDQILLSSDFSGEVTSLLGDTPSSEQKFTKL